MMSLEQLTERIGESPALNNPFYDNWISRRFDIGELEVFARNYGEWVKSFPDTLAVLFFSTDDLNAKTEYVNTLHSEMGYGNPKKVHWRLLDTFFGELSSKLGYDGQLNRDRLESEISLLPSTRKLIGEERRLYGEESREVAVGAQMALEWQAYTMLRKLYEGARNYKELWQNQDEFHEACEYFYAHIGEAEKEHKKESLNAARQYATDERRIVEIIRGYNEHLDLIAGFWTGVHEELTKPNGRE